MLARVTFLSLLLLAPAWSGEEAEPMLANLLIGEMRVPLLAEHLVLRLPEGAYLQEATAEDGETAEPDARQTLVVMDAGSQRMVLMARELQRTSVDLLQRAARYYAPLAKEQGPLRVTTLDPPSGGLHVLVMQPHEVDASSAPVPLFWAAVAHVDGSVQELAFYVNSAGATDLAAARSLARRILATLRPGPRRLPDAPHVQELEAAGAARLSLELPGGVAYSCQRGADFLVHHVEMVVPLGEHGGSLGVYEGHAPKELDESLPRESATILGRPADWLLGETESPEGANYSANLVLRDPEIAGSSLHLFVNAPTSEARAGLMRIAETLRALR